MRAKPVAPARPALLVEEYRTPTLSQSQRVTSRPEVSVVVPVYFNAESLEALYERVAATMDRLGPAGWDVTFVDDGSGDTSRDVLERLRGGHENVRVVHLSRNFGSTPAILAGIGFATGRCVAVLAADLQDPPEVLDELVEHWRAGNKVVVATRQSRDDPFLSRILAACYYVLFRALVTREMPKGGFDVAVMDAQVARLLVEHTESNTNFPAALVSLGFSRKVVGYHRQPRPHGRSQWTFWRKFKLMYDSILSFSYRPLRIMTGAGVMGVLVAVIYGAWIVYNRLTSTDWPPGWASLMVVTLFFNGMVLMSLGIVGEYIWRTFTAARKFPAFVVDKWAEPRGGVMDLAEAAEDRDDQPAAARQA